ncbi:interferon-induced very large GTPase 1-like [Mytilus trossulus]|uniref:interferon-induced very large GTPase 1-like n=1 Tax=Mytilus trossulus TaxID=6551 RepID=UPI003007F162
MEFEDVTIAFRMMIDQFMDVRNNTTVFVNVGNQLSDCELRPTEYADWEQKMDKADEQIERSKTQHRVLQDDYLQEVAESLLNDWWRTVLILSIPYHDIKAIENRLKQHVERQAFEGLILWKKKRLLEKLDENAMIDELINALKKVKREDLVFTISTDRDAASKMTLNRSMSSSAIVHGVFTDKYLYRIALQISTDLSAIFLNLGINQAQLDAINYSHRTDINRQALEALIKWRDQTDRKTNDSETEVSEKDSGGVNSDEVIQQTQQAPNALNVKHTDEASSGHNTKTIDKKKHPSIPSVKKLTSFFEKKISEIEHASNSTFATKQSIKGAVKLKSCQNELKRNSLPNEGTANQEKERTVHPEESDPLGGPNGSPTHEDKSTLLHRLGLEKFYPEKLTLEDVVGIHNISDNVSYKDVPFIFLRNIMMVNYNGRDILIEKVLDQLSNSQSRGGDWNVLDVNNELQSNTCEQNFSLNPLDLVVSVWLCSSSELRQALASKLFMCRLAVPLALPSDPGCLPIFNLWPLRSIILEQKVENTYLQSNPLNCPVHVVTCVRLGKICISKSVLMNRLLCDKAHSSFFNKDCNLGSTKRTISEGLIEIAWQLPTEKEQHITMFTNLRGDSYHLENEFNALSQLSSIVILMLNIQSFDNPETRRRIMALHQYDLSVVLAVDAHTEKESNAQQICQNYIKELGTYGSKIRICKVAFNKGIRGFAGIKKDIMREINSTLNNKKGVSLSKRLTLRKHCLFNTDEENKDFTEAKERVKGVMLLIKNHHVNVKNNVVPLQGQPWKELSRLLKTKERLFNITTSVQKDIFNTEEGEGKAFETYYAIKNEMSKHRKEQLEMYKEKGEILRYFIDSYCDCKSDKDRMLFTNFLKMDIDDISRTVFSGVVSLNKKTLEQFKRIHDVDENIVDPVLTEKETVEMNFVEASLGFEHLLRECGQLYEALRAKEDFEDNDVAMCDKLTQMAVELLLMGNPIELMDGDIANVPMQWIKAVMSKLKQKIGDKKLLNLSVLGIQSSGKSTLLNTMFGSKFAVSAGRCTRGVYMQLLPVKNTNFNYIAVIDTEGLRAIELNHQKYDHDNKLATFIIGIADATIINIKGENTTEMKDILQIAVHAFLRMKLVNDKLNFKQSCFFVHQNVPASDASIKMGAERQKLVEILDEMIKEAARQEKMTNIQYFNQVIEFNCEENVWYCCDLWEGNPPMAPTNPGYSKNASDVRDAVITKLASSRDTYLTITDSFIRIEDIWLGILRDDFVYGFRNSLELKAYDTVEERYQEIVRDMANFFYEYLIQAKTVIGGSTAVEVLNYQAEQVKKELRKEAEEKLTICISNYEEFIKESDLKDVMSQWSSTRKTQLKLNNDSYITETEKEIADLKEEQKDEIKQSIEKIKNENDINERARKVAIKLQGKQADDETIIKEFEDIWRDFFQQFSSSFKELEDTSFVGEKIQLFVCQIKNRVLGLFKEPSQTYNYERMTCLVGSMSADIFKIGEHIVVLTPVDVLADCGKYQESAVDITNKILQRIDNELYRITSEDRRFNVKCVSDIMKIIDEIIAEHNATEKLKQLNFNLMDPYNALVTTHVVRYITIFLTRNENDYIKRHSLRCRLENYKETALKLFRGVVAKETEDMIAANFFQIVLVEKVTQHVLDLIPFDVHKCMLKKYSNRKLCVMKEVMKDLARKKDFNNCFHYIMDPISFVEKWLTENMLATIFKKKQSGLSEYEQFANRYIKKIFDETKNKTQMTTQQCKDFSQLSVNEWIKRFCTNLSSSKILPVSEDLFGHVTKREKTDIFNFEATVMNKFDKMEDLVRDKFRETTSRNVKWSKNPISGVMSALWGCKAKCPFCCEPCTNTNPNHLNEKIRHQCLQHRVQGLSGRHWVTSQKLILKFCNTGIMDNDFIFLVKESRMKFQNYQDFFPEWYIEPTMDTSKYWIWLLCHFKQEFETRHGLEFVDIPARWTKITEDEALYSLNETDNQYFSSFFV